MKSKIIKIIILLFVVNFSQKIEAQSISAISLISTDIIFLKTIRGRRNVSQTVVKYKRDYYLLKLSIKVNNIIKSPLDVKLTSPSNKEKKYRVVDNIELLEKDKIYYYEFEVTLDRNGWYKIEIGDFTNSTNDRSLNIVFDKSSIYVNK